jgi:hypothetical protein
MPKIAGKSPEARKRQKSFSYRLQRECGLPTPQFPASRIVK